MTRTQARNLLATAALAMYLTPALTLLWSR